MYSAALKGVETDNSSSLSVIDYRNTLYRPAKMESNPLRSSPEKND